MKYPFNRIYFRLFVNILKVRDFFRSAWITFSQRLQNQMQMWRQVLFHSARLNRGASDFCDCQVWITCNDYFGIMLQMVLCRNRFELKLICKTTAVSRIFDPINTWFQDESQATVAFYPDFGRESHVYKFSINLSIFHRL